MATGKRRTGAAGRPDGFTLIEIAVVLAVITMLTVLIAPTVFQTLEASRETETEGQLEGIFAAIVGDPSNGNYGYLGDMGRLPTTLEQLVTQGSVTDQPTWHTTNHVGSVGAGWRGPYLTRGNATSDLFRDAWGLTLSYNNATGQITSGGPDGQSGTADDIIYPVQLPVQTSGTLLVNVVVNDIPQPTGVTVNVYTVTNGDQSAAVTATTTGNSGIPFRFDVKHGTCVIVASHTASGITVSRTVTVDIAGGTQVSRTILMRSSATVAM